MTQDQYGQARGSGYVVHDDVVPENETDEARTDESKPMTRFQKVASALRGGSEQDQAAADEADMDRATPDQAAADRTSAGRTAADVPADDPAASPAASESSPPWVTQQDEAAMAGSPIAQESAGKRDYWDDPNAAAGHEDDTVAVTSPDIPADHQATEPDMFGTTRRPGEETAEMAAARCGGSARRRDHRGRPGGPSGRPGGPHPGGRGSSGCRPSWRHWRPGRRRPCDSRRGDGEQRAAAAPAATTADGNLRPGEAAGNLGDFSDLTYGNLVPDAEQFTAQWQEIQFRFVDDPRGSVTEAADIVAQVTAKMEAAIQERQRAIEERQQAIAEQQRSLRGRWGEDSNADTENLRETLRMYKTFLDQLIGSRTSSAS